MQWKWREKKTQHPKSENFLLLLNYGFALNDFGGAHSAPLKLNRVQSFAWGFFLYLSLSNPLSDCVKQRFRIQYVSAEVQFYEINLVLAAKQNRELCKHPSDWSCFSISRSLAFFQSFLIFFFYSFWHKFPQDVSKNAAQETHNFFTQTLVWVCRIKNQKTFVFLETAEVSINWNLPLFALELE